MCISRSDLKPGAMVVDRTAGRLYEVCNDPDRSTLLMDVASPADDPRMTEYLTANAVRRLDLVRHAPCVADVASVEEWGEAG